MSTDDVVIAEKKGRLGLITLNRPKAVNALSTEMIGLFQEALDRFEADDEVAVVAVVGAGDRGLCAGGDVVALYRACSEDPEPGLEFFRQEYALDHRISRYPKPYVPIMSGLVLGGGVGISAPGSHRVATDSTRTGMPETGIGFSPDVAGTWYLSHAPGAVGTCLAITGQHIDGADAIYAGLADHYVTDAVVPELLHALEQARDAEQVGEIIGQFEAGAPDSALAAGREWIDAAFARDSLEEMRAAITAWCDEHPGDERAEAARDAFGQKSPTGMAMALEAMRRAPGNDVAQTLVQDFRTCGNAIFGHDMREGIRAQVIDKDRTPRWDPASIEEVSREAVLAHFDPIPGHPDLELPAD